MCGCRRRAQVRQEASHENRGALQTEHAEAPVSRQTCSASARSVVGARHGCRVELCRPCGSGARRGPARCTGVRDGPQCDLGGPLGRERRHSDHRELRLPDSFPFQRYQLGRPVRCRRPHELPRDLRHDRRRTPAAVHGRQRRGQLYPAAAAQRRSYGRHRRQGHRSERESVGSPAPVRPHCHGLPVGPEWRIASKHGTGRSDHGLLRRLDYRRDPSASGWPPVPPAPTGRQATPI